MKEVNSKARTASLKLLVEIGETFIRCSDQSKQGRLSLCDQVTGKGRTLIIKRKISGSSLGAEFSCIGQACKTYIKARVTPDKVNIAGPLLSYILEGTKPPPPAPVLAPPLKGFGPPSKSPFLSENERKSC